MKSIIVATDFSKRSDVAVSRASELAKLLGAKLTVVHIVDDDQSERLAAAAEIEAGALFELLSSKLHDEFGVEPSIVVTRGEPHEEILKAAKAANAELIVVGTYRRNLVRNTFIGTTAERSIRASHIPVLVVHSASKELYQQALIALDLNENDISPFSVSLSLGMFDKTHSSIIFAFNLKSNYYLLKQSGLDRTEVQKYINEEEKAVRSHVHSMLNDPNLKTSKILLKPALFNAHDPILETAAEQAADLIVVGTKRKQAFERLRIGSVSEAVLRHAEVDVLVIPPAQ